MTVPYSSVMAEWVRSEVLDLRLPEKTRHPNLEFSPGVLRSRPWWVQAEPPVIAETLRYPSGRFKQFLLNADGGINTFRNQQNNFRWVLARYENAGQGGVVPNARWQTWWRAQAISLNSDGAIRTQGRLAKRPPLLLPFSALEAAGIDRSTIQALDIRPDRQETEQLTHAPWDEDKIEWQPIQLWGAPGQHRISQRGDIRGRNDLRFQRSIVATIPEGDRYIHTYMHTIEKADKVGPTQVHNRQFRELTYDKRLKKYRSELEHHRLGDSLFSAVAHGARRLYVSSFDYQERWPLYFLAELPWHTRGHVKTVHDAILSLAPRLVHAAIAQERNVLRQGDMFAVPTSLTTRDVRLRSGRPLRRMEGVFGTDHLATEQYVCKAGVTYARGFLHHRPFGRRPDHASCFLGKDWHLIVPNAVPRRRAGAMVRG